MTENQLQFIWQYQLFSKEKLLSTYGEHIEILNPGKLNKNQGPDFLEAKVIIGDKTFYGHIELHIQNEDWYHHKHNLDSNYDNIILHVVLENTNEIHVLTSQNTLAPIFVLKDKISDKTLKNMDDLIRSKSSIPCEHLVILPEEIKITSFKQKLFLDRVIRKSQWIHDLIKNNGNDHETSFYQVLLYGFGIKVNADHFLNTAKVTPQKVLAKHKNNRVQIEALLFGQAKLLDDRDDYSRQLSEEYDYLRKLYNLSAAPSKALFSRLMPSSFPTIRLAQFAALVHGKSGLYSQIVLCKDLEDFYEIFSLEVSEYWNNHYTFGVKSPKSKKKLSREFIQKLLINCILPFQLFLEMEQNIEIPESIERYISLKPESNTIIKKMTSILGIKNRTALESQAIIEWYQNYCCKKRCLECVIGYEILKPRL